MINLKYCIKCKKAFDIGTNHNVCPQCRVKVRKKVSGEITR